MKPRFRSISLCLLLLGVGGCATIPPETYKGTANGYNIAMQETAEEQLLLNIVRLRYRDAPFFLEASSLTSQFDLSTSAGLSGTFPLDSGSTDVLQGSAGVNFSERPTISYTPLQGEDFYSRLLARIKFNHIALLADSGWSLDTIMRMAFQRTNGISNAPGASGPTPDVAPELETFREIADLFFELQKAGTIQLIEVSEGGEAEFRALRLPAPGEEPEADRIRELLSLDPDGETYRFRPGMGTNAPVEGEIIEYNTRSLLGVMFYLSQAVDVPEDHREAGIVTTTLERDGTPYDWSEALSELFRVEHSSKRPASASTSVFYRGHWFYLKDSDLESKDTLILLSQMFTLQTGDAKGQVPLLTIPVSN